MHRTHRLLSRRQSPTGICCAIVVVTLAAWGCARPESSDWAQTAPVIPPSEIDSTAVHFGMRGPADPLVTPQAAREQR
jgi:hypothetical protein